MGGPKLTTNNTNAAEPNDRLAEACYLMCLLPFDIGQFDLLEHFGYVENSDVLDNDDDDDDVMMMMMMIMTTTTTMTLLLLLLLLMMMMMMMMMMTMMMMMMMTMTMMMMMMMMCVEKLHLNLQKLVRMLRL